MKDEKKVEFTQKWIGDAVKRLLEKEDIYESDMEKIKYLRIGSDFADGYMIQMSTSTPPDPFYDTGGGDEWVPGPDGATVTGRFIKLYIDYMKENPIDWILADKGEYAGRFISLSPEYMEGNLSDCISSDTPERIFQLSTYDFWHKYEEEYEESEEDGEDWEDTEKKWKSFEKTILCVRYREEYDDEDAWDAWYEKVKRSIQQDIGLFTGLEALRIQGAEYQDMTFLRTMPKLRVWEVVETNFASMEGIDDLVRLKQLCCWLD
ncbi:MAG: hypothetical protein K2O91_27100 [Lachnospiraceae bacterium]|nr:hypothetical protein [Lachnospiraceae bacterium]